MLYLDYFSDRQSQVCPVFWIELLIPFWSKKKVPSDSLVHLNQKKKNNNTQTTCCLMKEKKTIRLFSKYKSFAIKIFFFVKNLFRSISSNLIKFSFVALNELSLFVIIVYDAFEWVSNKQQQQQRAKKNFKSKHYPPPLRFNRARITHTHWQTKSFML